MSSVDDKLRRGFDVLARADGDRDLLGVALVALHGALEDHLDEMLRRAPELSVEDHDLMDGADYGWRSRVALAQRQGLISADQGQAMLSANEQRRQFAHGAVFRWGEREVEGYADLAASICGRRATAAHAARPARAPAAAPQRTARAEAAVVPQAAQADGPAPQPRRIRTAEGTTTVASSRWSERPAAQRRGAGGLLPAGVLPDSLPVRLAIAAVAALLLLLAGWRLLAPQQQQQPAVAERPAAAIVTPVPTEPPVTPTPLVRRARIVNLGNAVGWLREQPSFTAATLPIPLSEGLEVTLVQREPVNAEGTTWGLVATGGYEGWAPLNNIAEILPSTPAPADALTPTLAQ